jgi:hypothetical protein
LPRRQTTRTAHLALFVLSALASYAFFYRAASLGDASVPAAPPGFTARVDPFARPDVPPSVYVPSANAAAERNPAVLVKAKHGAVATERHICSTTGVDIMKAGGNAIDAAIASTLCIGVVSMFSCVPIAISLLAGAYQ